MADRSPRDPARPIRIANCSGFLGDRPEAAREMVEGGPIDVLTGDYLAELTMALLWKLRQRGRPGYAASFLTQIEPVLGRCLDDGIRIVVNAGGLDPAGLATALGDLADRLGLSPSIAYVTGDDVLPRLGELAASGAELRHLDTGERLVDADIEPVTANAYLGGWPIADALGRGADVVVCPRVTDASLVVGPAAWWFAWPRDDVDALAGAVVAGHVIECGPQATGGNFAFFEEIDLRQPGFPIAEVAADGSSFITKHPGTGGAVTVDTVTAQLLYEIGGPRYLNPDVTARFDTVRVTQVAPDRVALHGTRGEPPPADLKVCLNHLGGYRNRASFVLSGLDIAAKAAAATDAFMARLGPAASYDELEVRLEPHLRDLPADATATGRLDVLVSDRDEAKVGRAFSSHAAALYLSSYPGFHLAEPPGPAEAFAAYWPTTIPRSTIVERVVIDGVAHEIEPSPGPFGPPGTPVAGPQLPTAGSAPGGDTVALPIGRLVGARSGDKGGNANLGIWVRRDDAYGWLLDLVTPARLAALVPELAGCPIDIHPLPHLRALNVVVHGLLGRGVSSSLRADPQAKALGEMFRAAFVDVPRSLAPATLAPAVRVG
jgi:Acyclic terpene utilisation family protein AtuA